MKVKPDMVQLLTRKKDENISSKSEMKGLSQDFEAEKHQESDRGQAFSPISEKEVSCLLASHKTRKVIVVFELAETTITIPDHFRFPDVENLNYDLERSKKVFLDEA